MFFGGVPARDEFRPVHIDRHVLVASPLIPLQRVLVEAVEAGVLLLDALLERLVHRREF